MSRPSKRIREIAKAYDFSKTYRLIDAIDILKEWPPVKFDQSVELSLKLGVDPRRSDQQVRGTVSLPNGTGKLRKILVFAKGDSKEALNAGADYAGNEELLEKVNGGWTDFDAVIATPDMMRDVGKLGKVLGPRGLMPTPKAGTVTMDVVKTIQELKGGRVEFKTDRNGVINAKDGVGKLSFSKENLYQNILVLINAIRGAKPPSSKGSYMKSLVLSSTMGPGIKIDLLELDLI